MLEAPHLSDELANDNDANFKFKLTQLVRARFVKRPQPGVFLDGRAMLVVAAGMNAVPARPEAANVAVKPGAACVDDDMAPLLHGGSLSGHCEGTPRWYVRCDKTWS